MSALFFRNKKTETSLTIPARTFFKVLLLILITMLVLTMLARSEYALSLILIAFFLALALNAPVSWVSKHLPGPLRGSRSFATSLAFLVVIVLLGFLLISFAPPIIRQTASFVDNVPHIVSTLQDRNSSVNKFITRYHLQGQVNSISSDITGNLRSSTLTALTAASRILDSLFSTLTILVLTFMMLIEGPSWLDFLRQLVPESHRDHADRLLRDMYRAVKGYVNGQVALAILASILVLPGLLVFHVSYPFALLGIVFVCGLIPMVGHTIGAVIVTIIALFHSPFSAAGILIYYILYQQIENYLIQPRLQANTTNLSPLLVVMSLVIGVSFDGLLGGLVAIPLVACIRVWTLDYLQSRHLVMVEVDNSDSKIEH